MVGTDDRFARIARGLVAATPIVSTLGLVVETAYAHGGPAWLADAFSLSCEANLPTAFAASLLAASAWGLASVVRQPAARPRAFGFAALAAVMGYAAIDEAVEIHEHLASLADGSGILHFSWVVPGAAIVSALALGFAPFLVALSAETRVAFVVAATVFVLGALGMELPLGLYAERHGDETFGYAFLDWIEETLEMVGSSLFLVSVVRVRARVRGGARP